MSVSGPLHNSSGEISGNQIPGVIRSKEIPAAPSPELLRDEDNRSRATLIAQPTITKNEEETKRFIAPDNIFHGVLTRLPGNLQVKDVQSYRLAVQDLRTAYSGIVHSLSLEGKQALSKTLGEATNMVNPGIAESDKLTALLAGVVSAFNPSDSDFKPLAQASDPTPSEQIDQLRSAFYKVLELSVSSKKKETAQSIMDDFYKLPLAKLPGLQQLKLLADRKDDVFSKLVVILPDLFKQIGDKDLDDKDLLISFKGILESAKQLPSRFTSTLDLDSSGKSFKIINGYRQHLVNLLIENKSQAGRERLIELLKADYPKKVNPN